MSLKQWLIRRMFGLARNIAPVIRYKNDVFVFRHSDVTEILKRDQDFKLGPVNAANISRHIGQFLLGMDAGPQLAHEQQAMYAVVLREDVERIRSFTRQQCAELLEGLKGRQNVDIVREFTRLVPLRMVADYFGTPGPDEETMLRWNRLIFYDIFLNFKSEESVRTQALEASKGLNAYLAALISERRAAYERGSRLPNDLISRLVTAKDGPKPWLDDDGIRRNVAGTLLGAEEPISKVCVHALEILFKRPKAWKMIKEAAQKDDIETVGRMTFDALRFNPSNPVILRQSEFEQGIGAGKQRKIKAGARVYAVTMSAMFDPKVFPQPGQIKSDRPYDHYLHFGYGLHVCYGSQINYVVIPEMMTALLKLDAKPLEKAATRELGFPDHWTWSFGA